MHGVEGLPGQPYGTPLTGRGAERAALDRLLAAVRGGGSGVLVLHGATGVGKSALLDELARTAQGCRVTRVTGVESEMELPFAGLHQLCAPLLEGLERLPAPQRDALEVTFGFAPGPVPDRFLVGLAVLTLLSRAAERRPLLCLVDDHQWLDRASARVLAFVARRLGAESVGLVLAVRDVPPDLAGLAQLPVHGLADADARALLERALTRPIDVLVRDQVVAEAQGNPLALLELADGLAQDRLAGGFGLPGALPLGESVRRRFSQRVEALPPDSRLLLLLVAADPCGDAALVGRAAEALGIPAAALASASDHGLADLGLRPSFRHPLIRSVVYGTAPAADRRRVHQALAEAIDAGQEPDRHAWHRAQAADGPDGSVAAELEQSAGRAQARGGLSAAAAFLRRAAELTPDPAARADRLLAAVEAEVGTGEFDTAADLLAVAATGPLSNAQQARADVFRARLAFAANRGNEASPLLLRAAERLRGTDPALARATYLEALGAALFAGRLALPGGSVLDTARAALEAPPAPAAPHASDLLLDGTAATVARGYAQGLPILRDALAAFDDTMPAEVELRLLWTATITAMRQWDDERWDVLSARHLRLARGTGALGELPLALLSRVYLLLFSGDLEAAAELSAESTVVVQATSTVMMPYCGLGVAAFRGDAAGFDALFGDALTAAVARGEGNAVTFAQWARALLGNGLGDYREAVAAAREAIAYEQDSGTQIWPTVELVEAAARTGGVQDLREAQDAYGRLATMTAAAGTPYALGIQARLLALLERGTEAEKGFRTALGHLDSTRLRIEQARTRLLFGEWLRRERRPAEAREQLRTAHGMFVSAGAHGFARRAGRELRAAGGTSRPRAGSAVDVSLTAQEAQIARLARDGLSNPEIGIRLFISPRTVQYHLRKVFTKLGITSRSQLDRALPGDTS
ncbi:MULTISPECIES: AAA family ATPase [unclassified Streptomyces]|uniref:helix-turn-helix transcriptional regulator n=1 Tax=unclassified Streptomyces TaxID=2593676 RepID=UPI0038257F00